MTAPGAKGSRGEDYAAGVLEGEGWRILARNAHSRYGEVDLIAERGGVVAFVEVKTRRRGALVTGAQSVTRAKRQKIIRTALLWLQQRPEVDGQPRFDLFSVETDSRGNILGGDHMEGAFDGEGYE